MKIEIDENLKGKELFAFLMANKGELIAQKKALPKFADPISYSPVYYNVKGDDATKTTIGDIAQDATTIRVKVVANTSMWCDSQMDVLLKDSAKKSISEGLGRKHLHDHIYQLNAQVGDVVGVYYQDISLSELGVKGGIGSAQALIYETDIQASYNRLVFNLYKSGKVDQHSIGLQYMRIDLAINDKDSEKEYDFWNKHINDVINKEVVIDKGYFWLVQEYKLLENSAVLFGANRLTPTLEVKDTNIEPPKGTEHSPSANTFNVSEAIKGIKLFTN